MKKYYLLYAILVIFVVTLLSWASMFDSTSNSSRSGYGRGYSGGSWSGGGGHK